MRCKSAVWLGVVLAAYFTTLPCSADGVATAREHFKNGQALLAQGQFEQALDAYKAAAEADAEELNYQVAAAVLERVIKMRQSLDKLEGSPKWAPMITALNSYFIENHAYVEALRLATTAHAKTPSADTAVMTARTHLEMGDAAAAEEFLGELAPDLVSPESRTLRGIALARLGKLDAARAELAAAETPAPENYLFQFDRVRLQAMVGHSEEAVAGLVKCFENTPPSRLPKLKTLARECPDLAGMHEAPEFAAALDTASKVKESSCSSGASCGQCPSRASCGSSGEKEKKEKP